MRRLKGQLDADAPCAEVMDLVASVRGAMSRPSADLIEEHIRNHAADPDTDSARAQAAAERIAVIRTYLK